MKTAAAISLAGLALLVAGCGGARHASSETAPSSVRTSSTAAAQSPGSTRAAVPGRCLEVPAQLAARIEQHVVLDGARLDRLRAVGSHAFPGLYFVSARVRGGGAPQGSLATWATRGLHGRKPIYSIDAFAALISEFGGAKTANPDFSVSLPAAYRSRVCVAGANAPHGVDAPLSETGAGTAG